MRSAQTKARLDEQARAQQYQAAQKARVAAANAKSARDKSSREMDLIRKRSAELRAIKVKRGDTAESLGRQYGVNPKLIADTVTNLRPGQTISISDRTAIRRRIEDQAKMVERAGELRDEIRGPDAPVTGGFRPAGPQEPKRDAFSQWIVDNIEKPLSAGINKIGEGAGGAYGDFVDFTGIRGDELLSDQERLNRMTTTIGEYRGDAQPYEDPSQIPGQTQGAPQAQEISQREQFVNDWIKENDMTREEYEEYRAKRSAFGVTMRYTGDAFAEAFRLQQAGESFDHIIQGSTLPGYEDDVLYLTSAMFNNGQGSPMWEAFSYDMQQKIIGLGYEQVEPGLWIPVETQPPDYGMGGYSFPGYGGGYGGGGGGDYEYLSRGGLQRRRKGGGESRGDRIRIFPEGVSPAHWRI